MPDTLLRMYHSLPPQAQAMVASVRGLQLRHRRYGPETNHLIAAARERETWTEGKWRQWQGARLAALLHHAATDVPWYREHWRERRQRGDRASWEVLENWPVLEKDTVRASPDAFTADSASGQKLFVDRTSGTTGKPLFIRSGASTLRAWYALYELRCRLWHGVSREQRWAMLGGQLVVPAGRTQPPFWVWNAGLRQLYLSSAHMTERTLPHYARALREHEVTHVVGYPSALAVLAGAGAAKGLLDVAIGNAEPVLPHQREAVNDGLGCQLRESYGMAEMVAGASECSAGRLHTWPEAGVVEVLAEDGTVDGTGSGELVCTGLLNFEMPLIRYRTGDRGKLPQFASCACGRTLPLMSGIEGDRKSVV